MIFTSTSQLIFLPHQRGKAATLVQLDRQRRRWDRGNSRWVEVCTPRPFTLVWTVRTHVGQNERFRLDEKSIYQSEIWSAGSTTPAHFHGDDDGDDYIHTRTCLQNINLLYNSHFLNWSNRIYPL